MILGLVGSLPQRIRLYRIPMSANPRVSVAYLLLRLASNLQGIWLSDPLRGYICIDGTRSADRFTVQLLALRCL